MVVYAGWQLQVYLATGSSYGTFIGSPSTYRVDTIQSISYDYNNRLEQKEEIGNRSPIAFVEGVTTITGTIERFYTGSGVHSFGFVHTTTGSALSTYGIMICPNGLLTPGSPYIILSDVKFDTQRMTHRPGSNLMTESLAFMSRYEQTGSF